MPSSVSFCLCRLLPFSERGPTLRNSHIPAIRGFPAVTVDGSCWSPAECQRERKKDQNYIKTRACHGAPKYYICIPARRRDVGGGRGRRHLRRPGRLKIAVGSRISSERERKKKREKTPTRYDDMHLSRLENGNRVAAEAFAVSCWSPIGIIYQTGRKRYLARRRILRENDTGNSRNFV